MVYLFRLLLLFLLFVLLRFLLHRWREDARQQGRAQPASNRVIEAEYEVLDEE